MYNYVKLGLLGIEKEWYISFMAKELYINEIATGTEVKITAFIGTEKLELSTTTVWVDDKQLSNFRVQNCCTVVEPILIDGKVVSLSQAAGIVYFLHAYLQEEEQLYEWKNVVPYMATLKNGDKYLVLICSEKGKAVNRREHFRIWIGLDGKVRFGISKDAIEVVIKDISSSGIGIIVPREHADVKIGSLANVYFYDGDMESEFQVSSIIVRKEDIDETRVLLGCRFSGENQAIAKYIQRKERLNLKKRSNRFNEVINQKKKQ